MARDEEYTEEPVKLEEGYDKFIVVDGCPTVTEEKKGKLVDILKSKFSRVGDIVDLTMPMKDKESYGFVFIEYAHPSMAHRASVQLDGQGLGKAGKYKLRVFKWGDFDKYMNIPDNLEDIPKEEYKPIPSLYSWLQDERARDQFCLRYGTQTEMHWNDLQQGEKSQPIYARENWTDAFLKWSPKGTYLVTVHVQGVQLWGGENWERIARFPCEGVKLVYFSPQEGYLCTICDLPNDDPKDPKAITVWDVRSARKLRSFAMRLFQGQKAGFHNMLQFSPSDEYVARWNEDALQVYSVPSMKLLDKKSIKAPGVRDFCWSPTDNILTYWVPEMENSPARVTLMSIPSREVKAQRNLYSVNSCRIMWQECGTYLCVKVDRHTKTKKTTFTNFELFRVKEKMCPTEVLEIKELVVHFAWEPIGHRFAVIHGEGPRPDISFYSMEGDKLQLLHKVEKKPANNLFWAPNGGTIVLAGLANLNGVLDFFDADTMTSMGSDEHFMCTNVSWDPSGRYLCTYITAQRNSSYDHGLIVWSHTGKQLYQLKREKFFQFLWRPRPPCLLSAKQQQEIKNNLKKYSKVYEKEDAKQRESAAVDQEKARTALREQFAKWQEEAYRTYMEDKTKRMHARHARAPSDADDHFDITEDWVETTLSVEEELV
eukprot:TRINITY_DN1397_c0_g1_i4.p1 TRINITY_DN1397_c0_g1~~TRINITY_DN1397_c0_g1_i4.p1  ORF type:complete len:654 (+),score=182.34 TRINITY_DN1397_c0_g1_i4:429-2390(+)